MNAKRSNSIGAAFLLTVGASGGTILLSLITGILTARFLGTDGRGHVATIQAWILTFAWASSLGFSNSMVYYLNKSRATRGQVLAATLVSIPLLGMLGTGMAQLALPWGFAAQSQEAIQLARLFFWTVCLVIGVESIWSLLMAYHWFPALNAVRLLQPLLYATSLALLLIAGRFDPFHVLLAQSVSYGVTLLGAAVLLLIRVRLERPPLALFGQGMSYGLRLQGVAFGQLVTNRLDLLMLPAFVTASQLGFYSIAVNVASMVMSLYGNLAMVVFPVASQDDPSRAASVIGRGLRITLYGGIVTVVPLGIASPWLISFVYGADFVHAVPSLLWLLPGVVLWSCTAILGAALQAAGKPGRASLAQLGGMVLTVLGLIFLLPRYGIVGAAATSTIAYSGAFCLTLWALRASTDFRAREVLALASIVDDIRWVTSRVQKRLRRRPTTPEELS